jgi:hypothetical protein
MTVPERRAHLSRNTPLILMSGAVAAFVGTSFPVLADGFNRTAPLLNAASSCAAYGPDYAAVEGGNSCVRIGGHVRVQLGSNTGLTPGSNWTAGQTLGHAAPATLRSDSDSPDTTPADSAATHLRIRGGLEYPDPFR